MKIGFFCNFTGDEREPLAEYLAGTAQILEERGFASIWVPEHVVGFPSYDPRFAYPYADDGVAPASLAVSGIVDPMSILTALAMVSTRLSLCTGIAILAQRNPVYFAKMATAIDRLSNGRFVAGLGLGWSAQEYEALGVPFEQRGARTDEYVQVIRSLWADDVAHFDGEHYSLPDCIQLPRPIRRAGPPLYFGGESDAALRRIARLGDGWIGLRMTPETLAPRIARLHALLAEAGRTREEIDIVVGPADRPCDADTVARYRDLGVSQVVMMGGAASLAALREQTDALAERFIVRGG